MLSPGRGKYHGRFHWPTFSNAAPCASCHGWIAVLRIGSNRSPSSRPAIAPKRDRRVVGAERRGAGRRDVVAERAGQDRHAVDVAELALVGAEAHRGVALHVLDRAEAFARGERDVGGRDVVLQVDERLGAAAGGRGRRHEPQRQQRLFCRIVETELRQRVAAARAEPCEPRRLDARREPLRQARAKREAAVARARRALGLHRGPRHEARARLVEARLAAGLRVQVHRRAPAARDREQVAVQRRPRTGDAAAVRRSSAITADAADALGARDVGHDRVGDDGDAGCPRPLGQRRRADRPAHRPPRPRRRRQRRGRAPCDRRCRCW